MALFTGKGDGGTTKIFGCDQERISKASAVPEALGDLDELNAFLGFIKLRAGGIPHIAEELHEIQENLFIVQAEVAGADKRITAETVEYTETVIYGIERVIPPVKNFSIAGGTETSALLDVARTISRRVERRVIAAAESGREVSVHTRAYLNRLSSLLFALARLANHLAGIPEAHPHY